MRIHRAMQGYMYIHTWLFGVYSFRKFGSFLGEYSMHGMQGLWVYTILFLRLLAPTHKGQLNNGTLCCCVKSGVHIKLQPS